jgi:hypothetical protein
MATRKQFGKLTKAARDRAAREGQEYGLTRRQVRERYNRGTYNPLARGEKRIPREYRDYAERGGGGVQIDWHGAAYANYDHKLGPNSPSGETYKYNRFTVADNTDRASDQIARIMAMATENELRTWASPQPDNDGNAPPLESWTGLPPGLKLNDLGYNSGGSWANIFWYH